MHSNRKVSKARGPDTLWCSESQFYTVLFFRMGLIHAYSTSVWHEKATAARPSLYNFAPMGLGDNISSVAEVIDLLPVWYL